MENKPLISIITVNYNNREGLQKTINSVLSQNSKDFEYIIIDGNSSDGSVDLIHQNRENISFWLSERDTGIYNAMNKGIKAARGNYILFMNSGDDFINNNVLAKQGIHLQDEDIICFDINVKGIRDSFVKKCPDKITFSFLYNDTLPHQSTFIKKSLFDVVGLYDEDFKIISDWKFFILALAKYNATYKHISEVISTFYMDGISSERNNRDLLLWERSKVLSLEFSIVTEDTNELLELRNTLKIIKASRKIKLLIKLGLLKKF